VVIFMSYWHPQLGRNSSKTLEADGCFMVKDMFWVIRRTIYCLALVLYALIHDIRIKKLFLLKFKIYYLIQKSSRKSI